MTPRSSDLCFLCPLRVLSLSCLRDVRVSRSYCFSLLPIGSFIPLCKHTEVRMGSALLAAYREYLERMFGESDDLVVVDMFTVPMDVNEPLLAEWADCA